MTGRTKRNLILAIALIGVGFVVVMIATGYYLARRFEPYIRAQAIEYLAKRFDSDVELRALRVSLPKVSPIKLFFSRGRGALAGVEGEGVALRYHRTPNLRPMFVMKRFAFEVDLGTLFDDQKTVHSVTVEGMEINIPPKTSRPDFDTGGSSDGETNVLIENVLITDSILRILPKDDDKKPLEFELHRIRLQSAGRKVAMKYDATLTNAKPPGEIQSQGTFGPWATSEPGDSPLAGDYEFNDADLGVFDGIAGILHSTGNFKGTLDSVEVNGKAEVPDFRLKSAGNRVPLSTTFNVLVDGTDGDTILKPVVGRLGSTDFKTSGAVIKREKRDEHRSISLDVSMPHGSMRDVLLVAMKGKPFMEGIIALRTKIDIPPLSGEVRQKLKLDGQFAISNARFLQSKIQNQIDTFSRRGQGKPEEESIVEVPSGIGGSFRLDNQVLTFRSLSFDVPGAGVDLAGNYNIKSDDIDLHGTLKLQAKVSQTMTGWKRWVLKPIDPFFSKQGAGTLLRIQVIGTSKDPKFGRDRGKNKDKESND